METHICDALYVSLSKPEHQHQHKIVSNTQFRLLFSFLCVFLCDIYLGGICYPNGISSEYIKAIALLSS